MSRKRHPLLKTTALTLGAALLAGAGSAHAEISDGAIRLGYLADMSGPYRDLAGPGGLEAMRMAIEEHGGSIHGAPIEVFSADDRNSADVGANTVREWIDQRNVDMVGGLVASSVTIAATRLLAEHDRIAMVSGAAALGITNEHCSPNHIQWVYDTHAMSNGTARAIVEEGGERWFIISADYAFGHSLEEEVSNVVTEMGARWSARCATRSTATTSPRSSCRPRAPGRRSSAWPTPVLTPLMPSAPRGSSGWRSPARPWRG